MTQWRPIDSAPKDGTKVLIWDGEEVRAAWWDAEFDSIWDEDLDDSVTVGAWTDDAVASFSYEEVAKYEPTHWMPMPSGPRRPLRAPRPGREI